MSDERKAVQKPFFHLLDQETEIVMKTSGRIYFLCYQPNASLLYQNQINILKLKDEVVKLEFFEGHYSLRSLIRSESFEFINVLNQNS